MRSISAMRVACAALLTALPATAAMAGAIPAGSLAGSISAGADFPVGGDVHGGVDTPTIPVSALAPLLTPVPSLPANVTGARLLIGSRTYNDIYKTGFAIAGDLAYGLGGGFELLAGVAYNRVNGGQVEVGSAALVDAAGATVGSTVPVFGRFGDYKAWSVEAGVRSYFGAGSLQPYVAARVGARFVDRIDASFTIPAVNLVNTLDNVPFYRSSTVFTAGLDVGLDYSISPKASIAVESGLRYAGGLRGDDAVIGGLGLASINERGGLLTIPLSVRARILF
jgi:hypothetical protein